MVKIRTIAGQSIEDIAIQHYGAVEGVFKLLVDNRDVLTEGFNHVLVPGTELEIDPDYAENEEMKAAIEQKQLTFATAPLGEEAPITGADFNDDFNNDFNSPSE